MNIIVWGLDSTDPEEFKKFEEKVNKVLPEYKHIVWSSNLKLIKVLDENSSNKTYVWSLGDLENKIYPSVEGIQRFAELIMGVKEDIGNHIICGPDIKLVKDD